MSTKPLFDSGVRKSVKKPKAAQTNGLLAASRAAYDASVTMTEPRATTDAFSNPMARTGMGTQNLLEATQYPMNRMSQNYALMNSLWRGNWIVQNIVGTIPEDITEKWFKVSSKIAPEYIDKLQRVQRTTQLRKSIVEGMCWGRLYGGAAGIILIEGHQDLTEPLTLDTIMPDSFKGLYIVDRWSGIFPSIELIEDINDPWFGYPEFYEVRNELGAAVYKVHHSRVIRFTGRMLPWIERIAESHWGQSEIEAIYTELVKRDNVSMNIASLTFKANLDVYEMDNLDQIFALGDQRAQSRFWNVLQAQSVLTSNLGTRVINKGDAWHQYQYSFAGLAEVYDSMMMDVSGAARIPVTKLFGRSPAGMNATGESDLTNYYDYIEQRRESDFRPIIEKLLPILAISTWGEIPDDLDFTWDSIRTPTETEKADIAQKKTASIIEVYNSNLIDQAGAMQELKSLAPQIGLYDNISDEMIEAGKGVFFKDTQQINDPLMGLLGGGANFGREEEDPNASQPQPGAPTPPPPAGQAPETEPTEE